MNESLTFQEYYPVNKLRNIAQSEAPSEYIILIDVDNVPNKHLERSINYHINSGFFDSEKVGYLN